MSDQTTDGMTIKLNARFVVISMVFLGILVGVLGGQALFNTHSPVSLRAAGEVRSIRMSLATRPARTVGL